MNLKKAGYQEPLPLKAKRKMQILKLLLWVAAVLFLLQIGCSAVQRKLLFYPTHHENRTALIPWEVEGQVIGYARPAQAPENVWLMLHGNGGQASDRAYALPCFSSKDAVFIMEYPGYGARRGKPSRDSFDAAALVAYRTLREKFPATPVCVVGESIGTGPASMLSGATPPPSKIVLIVPYDNLKSVACDHFPYALVSLILRTSWDNVAALRNYKGPIELFGAVDDDIIPVSHAKRLADSLPSAVFHQIDGGHNEWSTPGRVQIKN
ncbi:MAG TPA: hypothetical protein VMZ27_13125 [Candidatus Saccharimonadales bacterium]|nr:hypothetical protein [Candidatus Saccharimonadales bacterium]